MGMVMGVGNDFRRTHHQPAMLDTLRADQPVGQRLHVFRFAAEQDHFQAVIVVKVSVQGRDHNVVILMLKIG
jgi:hypothetical protein